MLPRWLLLVQGDLDDVAAMFACGAFVAVVAEQVVRGGFCANEGCRGVVPRAAHL
jgi:hypothetical protein